MYAVYTQCLYNTILYYIHPHAVYTGNTGALLALARFYTHVDDNDKVQSTCRKVSDSSSSG